MCSGAPAVVSIVVRRQIQLAVLWIICVLIYLEVLSTEGGGRLEGLGRSVGGVLGFHTVDSLVPRETPVVNFRHRVSVLCSSEFSRRPYLCVSILRCLILDFLSALEPAAIQKTWKMRSRYLTYWRPSISRKRTQSLSWEAGSTRWARRSRVSRRD